MAWDDTKTDAVDVLHAADYNEIVSQVKSKIAATDVTYENLNTNGDVGTTSGTVCAGDDSRLSDSRAPTSHGNEAHSSSFLTGIDIHGATEETTIADNDEILIYDTSATANRRMTKANLVSGLGGGGGGITWNEVTGTSQTAAADNGYIANNSSLVTVTLPSTCAVGKIIRITGKGAGGWKLAQNSGQSIRIGTDETTEGTSGYIESGSPYDSIEVICVTTDTEFSTMQSTGVLGVV